MIKVTIHRSYKVRWSGKVSTELTYRDYPNGKHWETKAGNLIITDTFGFPIAEYPCGYWYGVEEGEEK